MWLCLVVAVAVGVGMRERVGRLVVGCSYLYLVLLP